MALDLCVCMKTCPMVRQHRLRIGLCVFMRLIVEHMFVFVNSVFELMFFPVFQIILIGFVLENYMGFYVKWNVAYNLGLLHEKTTSEH